MRRLRTTTQFDRDLKRARRRGRKLAKLWAVIETLGQGNRLDARLCPHRLSGDWSRIWQCHIEPDWLLVWTDDGESLTLVRTGTHADLFG